MVLGRTYFFKLFFEWVVPFRFTVRDDQGRPKWVMTSAFLLGSDAVPGAKLQLQAGQSVSLVRGDGYLQSLKPMDMGSWYWIFTHTLPSDHLHFIQELAQAQKPAIWKDVQIMSARFMPAYDLYVVSEQSLQPVYASFQSAALPQLVAYLGLLALGYGAYRLAWATHLSSARQRELHVERMRELALRDALTGLPNRQALRRWLETRMSHVQGLRLTVYTCELFYLQRIREGFGYSLGEDLLRTVALQLQTFLPDGVFLARVEENRLTLVVPTDMDSLQESDLRRFFQQKFEVSGRAMHCPAAISCIHFPDDGETVEQLSQAAMIALAEARKDPYGPLGRFIPERLERSQFRLRIADRLKHALNDDALSLVYQPQVDLVSRKVVGVEALLRWQDEELGAVSPADFVPVAEEMGLMHELGQYVIHKALRECAGQQVAMAGIRLAINVCADELHRVSYWQELGQSLAREDWPAEQFELEMTERLLVQTSELRQQTWLKPNELGVRLAIDDFGTGYSSLAYLAQIPAQMMKIDRLFIDHLLESESYRTLVRSMIVLGQSMGMEVLAEGVETSEQLRRLREMGCDQAQGFYIARPMSMDALVQWMEQETRWRTPIQTAQSREDAEQHG